MENSKKVIYDLLVQNDTRRLEIHIDEILRNNIESREDWIELVETLKRGCQLNFQKHWLKTHHIILTAFKIPELLGVDCNLFDELRLLEKPKDIEHASKLLFARVIEIVKKQLKKGGSTLFFNINEISSTPSAIITSELIQARYRETILVLDEINQKLPSLTKEWVDVSRLWRTGNGFRTLKARGLGIHIHIKEYKEVRDLLVKEMMLDPNKLSDESLKLRKEDSKYLQFSKTLDEFVSGLIASRGVRGSFDPYYKTWIDHEGLDEF